MGPLSLRWCHHLSTGVSNLHEILVFFFSAVIIACLAVWLHGSWAWTLQMAMCLSVKRLAMPAGQSWSRCPYTGTPKDSFLQLWAKPSVLRSLTRALPPPPCGTAGRARRLTAQGCTSCCVASRMEDLCLSLDPPVFSRGLAQGRWSKNPRCIENLLIHNWEQKLGMNRFQPVGQSSLFV